MPYGTRIVGRRLPLRRRTHPARSQARIARPRYTSRLRPAGRNIRRYRR